MSPAICEEPLWRGVLQGELEKQRRPLRTVVIVGLFFGLFHLSVYRLVTTGMTGAILAIIRLRSGSIFPCMLFHAVFNTVLILHITKLDQSVLETVTGPAVWIPCLAILALSLWGMRPAERSATGVDQGSTKARARQPVASE